MLNQLNLNRHISRQYGHELEELRHQVMAMGGLVEQQLAAAIRLLSDPSVKQAEDIIEMDKRVNAYEVHLDEQCTRIIAKRQPAASDLRLLVAIIKTITDLERIGDVAESIGRMVLENNQTLQYVKDLEVMGQHVIQMLHSALNAFARMDAEAALKVHGEDRVIDREYEAMLQRLMKEMMENPSSVPDSMNLLWSARSLERAGDHCQNIAEYIIYFLKGKDVRHLDNEQIGKLFR